MLNKTLKTTLAGTALVLGMTLAGAASASFIPCDSTTAPAYDISTKVNPNKGCTILAPLNDNVNDSVSPPSSSYTVNQESFFNFSDWLFDGKYETVNLSTGTDNSSLFNFTGGTQSGSFSKVGSWNYTDVMFVFKDGSDTNLVGYLIDIPTLGAGAGTYASPFTEPPFDFPGAGPRDISHISVYYRDEGVTPPQEIPEPVSLSLLGLGLLALGAIRRRKVD